jgi:hypothetical protein
MVPPRMENLQARDPALECISYYHVVRASILGLVGLTRMSMSRCAESLRCLRTLLPTLLHHRRLYAPETNAYLSYAFVIK